MFDPKIFLSTFGTGRKMMTFKKGHIIFAQGDPSLSFFVVQAGSVRLCAKSQDGKVATLDILGPTDFVGEDSISGQLIRTSSASALTDCTLLRIDTAAMMLALDYGGTLSNTFCSYVLARNIRYQQDLVNFRCNSSEMRLARVLLQHSHFDHNSPETVVIKINHQILANMVGTTRSRVCGFMKKFKNAGYIDYIEKKPGLRIRQSLLAFYTQ